jgi:AcrR family transcriptional regulator
VARADRSRPIDRRTVRWDEHKAARRAKILDAAVELIEERPAGSDIRVQHIAERAGLTRTVVYRHFDGRADLDRAIQAHIVAMVRDAVEPRITIDGTIADIITRIVAAYVNWVRQFILFHGKRHPRELGAPEVEAFLTGLALRGRVAPSTQNQALSALLFMYRHLLGKEPPWVEGVVRA